MIVHAINMSSSSILETINVSVYCMLESHVIYELCIQFFQVSNFTRQRRHQHRVSNFEVSILQVTLFAFFLGKYLLLIFWKEYLLFMY